MCFNKRVFYKHLTQIERLFKNKHVKPMYVNAFLT